MAGPVRSRFAVPATAIRIKEVHPPSALSSVAQSHKQPESTHSDAAANADNGATNLPELQNAFHEFFGRGCVLVSVDMEAFDGRQMTEAGIVTFDTRTITPDFKSWIPAITPYHFRIEEHKDLRGLFFVSIPKKYNFGQSQFVPLAEIADKLDQIISEFESDVILVAHDMRSDVSYLKKIGFDPDKVARITDRFDPQKEEEVAHANLVKKPKLEVLTKSLGISTSNMHNAGNDAFYTLQCAISQVVHEKRPDLLEKVTTELHPMLTHAFTTRDGPFDAEEWRKSVPKVGQDAEIIKSITPPHVSLSINSLRGLDTLHPTLQENLTRIPAIRELWPSQKVAYHHILLLEQHTIINMPIAVGKTLMWALPIIDKLLKDRVQPQSTGSHQRVLCRPAAFIVAPTHEIVHQHCMRLRGLIEGTSLRVVSLIGGISVSDDHAELERGADIIVATPGRLLHWLAHGSFGHRINSSAAEFVVVDEADKTLRAGSGLRNQMATIANSISRGRNRATSAIGVKFVLSSVHSDNDVRENFTRFLASEPVDTISVGSYAKEALVSEEFWVHITDDKFDHLGEVITTSPTMIDPTQHVLIFVNTRQGVTELVAKLREAGLAPEEVEGFHGGKSEGLRQILKTRFEQREFLILVTTHVFGRGINFKFLHQVIHFDCPRNLDDYIHSSGRVGRPGQHEACVPKVVTFMDGSQDEKTLRRYQQTIQRRPGYQLYVDGVLQADHQGQPEGNADQEE